MSERRPISASTLFAVRVGSTEPIYVQLVDQVARWIAAGQLVAGDQLPSVRDVAQAFAINPMTVSKAYSLLESRGLVTRNRGVGMVVAAAHVSAQTKAQRLALLRPTLERAADEALQLEIDRDVATRLFAQILKGKEP